jgi:hypothetical protein
VVWFGVRILKTKTFARWSRKERIRDSLLAAAVDEMRRGLFDAQLGGGLFKKRVPRPGGGKSGGYRTLLAMELIGRCVFLYGFAKSERDDIDDDELSKLKSLARAFLSMDEDTIGRLLKTGELLEVKDGE